MRKKEGRGSDIARAIRVIEFVSTPAWRSVRDLETCVNGVNKTARRWRRALEDAGVPLEFTADGSRFRRMR